MAADNKEYVTVLSTDMSKAFDSLHPALMIKKLKAYGFNEPSLNLLRSFFERRKNRVKLQEEQSAWKEQKRGCPQGSSFGPLLWNLFQNDLSIHRQSANLFMYADDHQVYTNDNDIHKATQTLRRQTEAASQCDKGKYLDRIDRFFRRAFKFGYTNNLYVIAEVIRNRDCKLWSTIPDTPSHPLYQLLPPKKQRSLRNRGHDFILPAVKTERFKRSFINRCLFNFI